MTRIDGIIILDTNGKPLITSHFPLHPASYPSVHIDAYNHALKRARVDNVEVPAIVWVQNMVRGGMSGGGLCHLEREGLRYLVPVGQEGELLHESGTGFCNSFSWGLDPADWKETTALYGGRSIRIQANPSQSAIRILIS